MRITLLGASGGEVTGSAYLLQADAASVLIDCGLFQGARKVENYNRLPKRGPLQALDAVVLTHAHLDHTGRLPLLTRFGYSGPIYATPATIDLTNLSLRDSARLQSEDAKRENRRRAAAGKAPIEPLYTARQVEQLRPLFRRMRYDHPTEVAPGIAVRAVEAGHVLGSASLEVTVKENGRQKVVVFSGDLGPRGAPLHRDPTPFQRADLVFMESTYGDRDHLSLQRTAVEAREAVKAAVEREGRILVPVFAIGRTQLLLFLLVEQAFEHKTFFSRLHHFVIASDAFVVVPGGIGTVLETLMIWQLLQVRHVENVPLILVGKMWSGLVEWARASMLDPRLPLASPEDLRIPRCLRTADEAIAVVRDLHAKWLEQQHGAAALGSGAP